MRRFFLQFNLLLRSLQVQGSFARNFAITFSGNSVAIVAGLFFTPFISRIYTPAGYGSFAIYMAIAQNVSLLATLQLTRAFVLPREEADFRKLYTASIVSTVACSVLMFLLTSGFHSSVVTWFGLGPIAGLIYFLPLTVLLYAINDILRSVHVRHKNFKSNATSQIISSVTSRSGALSFGMAVNGNGAGLIIGDTGSKIVENIYLWLRSRGLPDVLRNYSANGFQKVLINFKNYPLFVLPGVWLSTLANQMPLFFTARWFTTAATGNYSFANSLLNMPVAVLAGAISPVFLQKASEVYNTDRGEMPRIVQQLADRLFYLGLGPILLLTAFGEPIFRIVLGDQWGLAGEFAGYLGVHYLFFIVANPLTSLYRIYRREQLSLFVTVGLVATNTITLSVGSVLGDLHKTIMLFSVGNVLFSVIQISIILRMVSVPLRTTVLRYVLIAGASLIIIQVLKMAFNGMSL